MTSSVQKWGNSLGLRIPATIASEMHMKRGTPVTLRLDDGDAPIRIARPSRASRRRPPSTSSQTFLPASSQRTSSPPTTGVPTWAGKSYDFPRQERAAHLHSVPGRCDLHHFFPLRRQRNGIKPLCRSPYAQVLSRENRPRDRLSHHVKNQRFPIQYGYPSASSAPAGEGSGPCRPGARRRPAFPRVPTRRVTWTIPKFATSSTCFLY